MPVIAIIGAVAAISVAVEVGTTLAIIAAVGATIGAIGAVTNNKGLMIAGGVIGAIGGIGALAQSAGIIGADAFSFGSSAASAAGDVAPSAINQAASGLNGIDAEIAQWSQYGADLGTTAAQGGAATVGTASLDAAPTQAGTSQLVDQTTGALQPVEASTNPTLTAASTPDVTPTAAVDNGVTIPQGDGAGGTLGTVGNPADPAASGVPSVAAPSTPSVGGPDPNATTSSILNGGQGVTGAPAPGTTVTGAVSADIPAPSDINRLAGGVDPSPWTGIKDFLKNNGTLASGIVQAGSSFIAGATNGLTPAQIAALNAQAAANQAAANLSRTQQANMAQPLPVASRTPPVTGAPAGIINTPPPQIPVTGAA